MTAPDRLHTAAELAALLRCKLVTVRQVLGTLVDGDEI